MKITASILFLTAFVATLSQVKASTIPFAFSAPNGSLGFSQTYLDGGMTITARGYTGVGSPNIIGANANLYGKNSGGDETGLGMTGTSDYEIGGNDFIQLDFTDVKSQMLNPTAQLMIGSVQSGESYRIFGSNTVGVPGTMLLSTGTIDGKFFAIPNFETYSYFSVSAPKGDVLLTSASIAGPSSPAVPEPGTLSLLICAGLGMALFSRRARRYFAVGLSGYFLAASSKR